MRPAAAPESPREVSQVADVARQIRQPPSVTLVPADQATGRDERLDLIRGMAMVIALTVHLERPSLFVMFCWERIGVVSGAEAFVLLAGVVLAQMARRTWEQRGPRAAVERLFARAGTVYRAHLMLIVGVWLFSLLPGVNLHEVMTFTDRSSGVVYPTYALETPLHSQWLGFLILRAGPHQVQVFGLYAVLMALVAPLVLLGLHTGQTRAVLALSFFGWCAYNLNPTLMPTGANFEYAFPLLAWQFLFTLGLVAGFHWKAFNLWLQARRGWLLPLSVVVSVGFAALSWNNPNPNIPEMARLSWVSPAHFSIWYGAFFQKSPLGILRLLNDITLFVAALMVLNLSLRVWKRSLGWLLLPLGQNSLYVFFMHVPLVALAALLGPFGVPASGLGELLTNTGLHVALLLALLVMVKTKFLFSVIPR
jgi:hypothetical protein